MEFVEPWFLQRKLSLDINLFYRNLDYLSLNSLYYEVDAGMRVGLTRALGSDFLIGSVGYSHEDIGILFNQQTSVPTGGGRPGMLLPGLLPTHSAPGAARRERL